MSGAGICLRPAWREPAADSQQTEKNKKVDRELLYNTAQNYYILMTMLLCHQGKTKLHLVSFVPKGRNGYKTF